MNVFELSSKSILNDSVYDSSDVTAMFDYANNIYDHNNKIQMAIDGNKRILTMENDVRACVVELDTDLNTSDITTSGVTAVNAYIEVYQNKFAIVFESQTEHEVTFTKENIAYVKITSLVDDKMITMYSI
jgi:hypothetical protein